jgi:PAS domain S-box-containing protein
VNEFFWQRRDFTAFAESLLEYPEFAIHLSRGYGPETTSEGACGAREVPMGKAMSGKRRSARNKLRRVDKRRRGRTQKAQTSDRQSAREVLGTTLENGVSLIRNHSDGRDVKKDLGIDRSVDLSSPFAFRDPKNELEAAVQRYVDLYEFAPIAYVSLDRFGRIEESNLAAIALLQRTRKQLVGELFALRVVKDDSELFLGHLLRCRRSETRVETELHLRNKGGEPIPVQLSSSRTRSLMKDERLLYHTAIIDLTERKATEAALRESKERLMIATNAGRMFSWEVDLRSGRIFWSDNAEQILNIPRKSFPKTIIEAQRFLHPLDAKEAITFWNETVKRGQAFDWERRHFLRGGGIVWLNSQGVILRDEKGNAIRSIGLSQDITERKRAEESLAEAARQREALYNFVQRRHEAKSLADIRAAALDAVLSVLHCDRASILLLDTKNIMRFVDWRGLSERYRRAVEGHSPWKPDAKNPKPICISDINVADLPQQLKRATRAEGIGAAAFIPLIMDRKLIGKFMVYYDAPHVFTEEELGLSLNISGQLALGLERKQAEEALRISEERLRAVIDQAVVGIARCDLKGRVVFINDTFCKMLGYNRSELIGKSVVELTHPDDANHNMRLFRNLVAKSKPFQIEKRYLRKDGSILWASVSVSPMRDATGKTDSAVAVAIDVSDSKKSRAALEEAKRLLETRVHERTAELVAANEELQNEIALRKRLEGEIIGVSDREQRRLGQDLHDSLCQHLAATAFLARASGDRIRSGKRIDPGELDKISQLINDGVTEARTIARGLHPVEMDPAGLHTALHSLLSRQSQLPYRLDMDEEPPISDPAVALHLYRIAREAVINANKHARAREILVRMRSSAKRIELSVTDDGIGVSPDSHLGPGMGLQIMDYRARSIGGQLEIKTVRPHGTRVACYLPRK